MTSTTTRDKVQNMASVPLAWKKSRRARSRADPTPNKQTNMSRPFHRAIARHLSGALGCEASTVDAVLHRVPSPSPSQLRRQGLAKVRQATGAPASAEDDGTPSPSQAPSTPQPTPHAVHVRGQYALSLYQLENAMRRAGQATQDGAWTRTDATASSHHAQLQHDVRRRGMSLSGSAALTQRCL